MPERLLPALPRPLLLLTILIGLISPGALLAGADKRDRAEAAYQRAVDLRSALEASPLESRSPKNYERVVRAFDIVYRIDPGYPRTPAAIAAEASTYREMGGAFASDRYYGSAVATYQFLIDQYPTASLARDALFTIAEIYRADLEDPEEAAASYGHFLEKYPRAAQAEDARARLEQINRRLAAARAESPPVKKARGDNEDTVSAPSPQPPPPGGLAEVDDVHFWQGGDYTRIVIGVKNEVKFEAVRLSHPDRIVFDLSGARLSSTLSGRSFAVENGFLRKIRLAQFTPETARVVLDIAKIGDYSVFSLPNPFRLIIDVHGPQAPQPLTARTGSDPLSDRAASTLPPSSGLHPPAASGSPDGADGALTPNGIRQPLGTRVSSPGKPVLLPDPPKESASSQTTDAPEPAAAPLEASVHPAVAAPEESHPPAATSSGATTLTRALGLKISRIVIDPGHGGHDTGTIGPAGLEEKAVVLDVALRLKKLIEQRLGSSVVMTRSDDTFVPLEERTAIANQQGADLFISVHANASSDPSARGIEVYYLNFTSDPKSLAVAARENSSSQQSVHELENLIKKIALSEKIEESSEFAQQVDEALHGATAGSGDRQPNRGLKKAPFVVLIGADMPSILAEISFLTNPRDEKLLQQARYRQKIAEGLYRGVARYVSNLAGVKVAERSHPSPPALNAGARTRLAAHSSRTSLTAPPSDP